MAKHLTGFGAGVMELALKHRGDAFRVVYALRIGEKNLGRSCIPEEIQIWDENATRRNSRHP
jgi:hypothetical protein